MIIKFQDLEKLRSEKITYVVGTFDILHIGHIFFLEEAKKAGNGNKLLVGIIPDKVVVGRKGEQRPVVHEEERAVVIDSLKLVDYVFITPVESLGKVSTRVVEKVRPEFAVISRSAWESRKDPEEVTETNLIILEDEIVNRSTTAIIEKIRKDCKK